jgi:hypothetical protein
MFCLYTLPLARPAQAKIQILTAISSIVKLIPLNLYLVQLIEQQILRIPNFSFPNLRC